MPTLLQRLLNLSDPRLESPPRRAAPTQLCHLPLHPLEQDLVPVDATDQPSKLALRLRVTHHQNCLQLRVEAREPELIAGHLETLRLFFGHIRGTGPPE